MRQMLRPYGKFPVISKRAKMYNDQNVTEIVQKILSSKKYKSIYDKTVERVVKQCLEKYEKKHSEKKARNILHQIWSAYYDQKPDYKNILDKFMSNVNNGGDAKQEILKLISIQSSTSERIPILDDFYGKIFSVIGCPSSIIEHACGFNPLTTLWMNLPENMKYQAFDIENDLIDFLKSVIDFLNLSDRIEIRQGDVLIDEFDYADVVFMLKFLPVIEQQQKGSSLDVMRKQKCRYMVVSFPVKSLSGIEKGMSDFYSNWFKNLIKDEDWQYDEILYNTELVFVVQKDL